MSRTSLTVAALLTGVLAIGSTTTGCGTAEASPAVRPVNVALVNSGGAEPPSGEYVDLAVRCGDDLRDGRDSDCDALAVAASASSDSQVVALAKAAHVIALTNQGDYAGAARLAPELPGVVNAVHPSSRPVVTELAYSAVAIAFAATGDQASADAAVRTAQDAAPAERDAAIAAERCKAAPTTPSCSGTAPPTVPPWPGPTSTGPPETPTSPAPTGEPTSPPSSPSHSPEPDSEPSGPPSTPPT